MEGERQRQIDQETREMVSEITSRFTDLHHVHKPRSSHEMGHDTDHGVGIITLSGSNTGAIMRGELLGDDDHHKHDEHHHDIDDLDGLDTYVNSNNQAVNNSIMLGGSYASNDPGIHMDIANVVNPATTKVDKHGRGED